MFKHEDSKDDNKVISIEKCTVYGLYFIYIPLFELDKEGFYIHFTHEEVEA